MKKTLSIMLAAVATMGALALAACGDGDDGEKGKGGAPKSDKVATAAEWAAAFDFSEVTNATLYFKQSGTYYDEDVEATTKLDVEKMDSLENFTAVDKVEHFYFEYKADELGEFHGEPVGTMYSYSYDETAQKWFYTKHISETTPARQFEHLVRETYEDILPFDITASFDEFTYDENNYEYVATWESLNDDYRVLDNVVIKIKIKDGKMAEGSIECYVTDEYDDPEWEEFEGTFSCEFKIYDIGKTVVNIPTAEEKVITED